MAGESWLGVAEAFPLPQRTRVPVVTVSRLTIFGVYEWQCDDAQGLMRMLRVGYGTAGSIRARVLQDEMIKPANGHMLRPTLVC